MAQPPPPLAGDDRTSPTTSRSADPISRPAVGRRRANAAERASSRRPSPTQWVGWALLVVAMLIGSAMAVSSKLSNRKFQLPDIHEVYNSTSGRTHLRGIRRIPAYPTQPAAVAPIARFPSQILADVENPAEEESSAPVRAVRPPGYTPTPASFPITPSGDPPIAVAPRLNSERPLDDEPHRSDRFHSLAPLAVGPSSHIATPNAERRLQAAHHLPSPTESSLARHPLADAPHFHFAPTTAETMDAEKQRRLQARWRKIGPLVGSNGSRYQRMRLIQQRAWTHPPSTTTPTTTVRVSSATTRRRLLPFSATTPRPDIVQPTHLTAAQMAMRSTEATNTVLEDRGIRRQSPPLRAGNTAPTAALVGDAEPVAPSAKPAKPARAFAAQQFGSRLNYPQRRINGPILTPLPENPSGGAPVQPHRQIPLQRGQLPTAPDSQGEEEGPTIDFAPAPLPSSEGAEDYHHRQGMRAEKRFRLVSNRLINRPRLRIRTHHEEVRARGETNIGGNQHPIQLPELQPFDSPPTGPSRRQPPVAPPTLAASHSPKQSPPGRPRQMPRVTAWGDEDAEAIAGGDFDAGSSETGDSGSDSAPGESGAAFGAALGTPPPGFAESFGLNGENPFTAGGPPPTEEPTTEATTTRATRKPKPTPSPDAPLVIPENSGLRPAQPPKEFQGGFGSKAGSPFSGFGPGGGSLGGSANLGRGGGGFGPPPAAPPAPPPAPKGRGRKPKPPPEPELKEEDFFTGDSALTPNNRGPTGDGYGPPVFPGAAIPPAVHALSSGGGAAGVDPSGPASYQPAAMEVTENTPTTIRPSALLNILHKADEGFNQVLNHFEQGTSLDSAAIDILEVALGSQKLDSQAKLLSHVDRTIGLDNLQRLQRWANTGGALDMFKEQFVKIAKNYKPPPEATSITIPPQLEYLFQSGSSG